MSRNEANDNRIRLVLSPLWPQGEWAALFCRRASFYTKSMTSIAEALGDPAVRGVYLALCLALVLIPLVALWLWTRKRAKAGTVDRPPFIRVALLTLLWLVVNAIALGFMMWADTVNGVAG